MFLNGYIRNFGKYSFKEHPFNDVDALVFAEMSYLNLDLVLNKEKDGSILLGKIDLSNIDELIKQQSDALYNKVMLPLLVKSKRYKDVVIKDVVSVHDNTDACQFYAITIFFEDRYYISFRGTDLTLRGWKEDILMTYREEIPGQKEAQNYVNKITKKYEGKFYIGGHSKGGNLAVYGGYKLKEEHFHNLVHVYSFDGPGFCNEKLVNNITESPVFKKIIKYVPRQSVVGIVLKHTKIAKIIESQAAGVFQHDPFSWKITKEGKFKIVPRRDIISFIGEKALNDWLDGLSKDDINLMINVFIDCFGDLGIDLLYIITHWWESFKKIRGQYRLLPEEDKNRLKAIGTSLIKLSTRTSITMIKERTQQSNKKEKEKKA